MFTGKFLYKHTKDTVIPQLVCLLVSSCVHVCVCVCVCGEEARGEGEKKGLWDVSTCNAICTCLKCQAETSLYHKHKINRTQQRRF
jgi:hypothetical protein